MKKVWQWLVLSSVNPSQTSRTVQMALLAIIPMLMNLIGLGCTTAIMCIPTDAGELTKVFTAFSDIVFWLLSIVSGIGFLWAFARKIALTLAGKNPVLNQ